MYVWYMCMHVLLGKGMYVEALLDCVILTGSSESELKSLLKVTFKGEAVAQLLEFLPSIHKALGCITSIKIIKGFLEGASSINTRRGGWGRWLTR